jgi:hypothetical protein
MPYAPEGATGINDDDDETVCTISFKLQTQLLDPYSVKKETLFSSIFERSVAHFALVR